MRLFSGSLASLLFVMLVIGCNTVDPSQCWTNTSGGFGGGGTIPIGAGVGATSGDFPAAPPRGPLDYDGAYNPCMGGFSDSLFKFNVINKDDPSDVAGGWQEADATLKFVDNRQEPMAFWTCTVKVAMPLRTVAKGAISAEKAAEISAEIATDAASAAMHARDRWTPAEFCNVWRKNMGDFFRAEPYKGYYVTVKP